MFLHRHENKKHRWFYSKFQPLPDIGSIWSKSPLSKFIVLNKLIVMHSVIHYCNLSVAIMDYQVNSSTRRFHYAFLKYSKIWQNNSECRFRIKHKKSGYFAALEPCDKSHQPSELVLKPSSSELFEFDKDQLRHVSTNKIVVGKRVNGAKIIFGDDYEVHDTSCFPFDYDSKHCLIAGGDSYFMGGLGEDDSPYLRWFKHWNANDNSDIFADVKNIFEFEFCSTPSPCESSIESPVIESEFFYLSFLSEK